MDEAGARLILLLSTCVPELIGLDLESICHEMQPEVKAMLIHLPWGISNAAATNQDIGRPFWQWEKPLKSPDTREQPSMSLAAVPWRSMFPCLI